jgi:hypothetical protein
MPLIRATYLDSLSARIEVGSDSLFSMAERVCKVVVLGVYSDEWTLYEPLRFKLFIWADIGKGYDFPPDR